MKTVSGVRSRSYSGSTHQHLQHPNRHGAHGARSRTGTTKKKLSLSDLTPGQVALRRAVKRNQAVVAFRQYKLCGSDRGMFRDTPSMDLAKQRLRGVAQLPPGFALDTPPPPRAQSPVVIIDMGSVRGDHQHQRGCGKKTGYGCSTNTC